MKTFISLFFILKVSEQILKFYPPQEDKFKMTFLDRIINF